MTMASESGRSSNLVRFSISRGLKVSRTARTSLFGDKGVIGALWVKFRGEGRKTAQKGKKRQRCAESRQGLDWKALGEL